MLGQIRLSVALRIGMVAVVRLPAGCDTLRYGGAPEPSFDLKTETEQPTLHFGLSTSITDFNNSPCQAARNKFNVGRLTLMNLRYFQFIRYLTCDRQILDSATGMVALGVQGTARLDRPHGKSWA